ncbi:MAG: ribosome maturation factor RimP [Nitrococcus sp.]|nr:ribosome maturation factor RimP [Nitrococcus sp.]
MTAVDALVMVLEPVVVAMGYELVGIEYRPGKRTALLRIYIDKADSVSVEDCALVSNQIGAVLDVEDPLSGRYTLEVSSPGLRRPIFKASDYDRFAGERVHVRIQGTLDGRRRIHGILRGLRADCVIVVENGIEIGVPLDRVDRANLELEA